MVKYSYEMNSHRCNMKEDVVEFLISWCWGWWRPTHSLSISNITLHWLWNCLLHWAWASPNHPFVAPVLVWRRYCALCHRNVGATPGNSLPPREPGIWPNNRPRGREYQIHMHVYATQARRSYILQGSWPRYCEVAWLENLSDWTPAWLCTSLSWAFVIMSCLFHCPQMNISHSTIFYLYNFTDGTLSRAWHITDVIFHIVRLETT